jgi:hypothetical protein
MTRLMSLCQDNLDILGNLMDLFQFFKREKTFDANRVKRAFADAGISFHFIFMEKKSLRVFGGTVREQSEDIYPGFTEIARATGGISESSQNPAVSFNRAAEISENYYLQSYTPGAYSPRRRIPDDRRPGPGWKMRRLQPPRLLREMTGPVRPPGIAGRRGPRVSAFRA